MSAARAHAVEKMLRAAIEKNRASFGRTIERLKKQRDAARNRYNTDFIAWQKESKKAEAAYEAALDKIARLEAALRPFTDPENLEDCRLFDEPLDSECDCAWCKAKAEFAEPEGKQR